MKKFIPGKLFACPGSFSKALIFMKISFVLLFGFCLQTAAKGYSQGDVKITLELNGVKLSKALSVIEEKSGYRILYSNDDLPASRIVHIQAREELLSAVLDKLLADANLQYKIFDNTRAIVISSAVQKPDAVIHISGKVTDVGGNPLAGVTIKVKDTQLGTVTDAQGAFDLRFPDDVSSVVVFSYVGFQTREIKVKDGQKLHVVLEQAASGLDEVIVLGYGRQKKVSLTAAVASIGGNELVKAPVANISNTLGGRVAGIISRQANGAPGEDNDRIQIRGIGTTGNSAPLVVVNGIPMSYNQLNPNEIETVTILKDAAAVAPYGLAGANGVILITTKRGKEGKFTFNYDGFYGFQRPTNMPDFLNAYEYASMYNQAQINDGKPPTFTEEQLQRFKDGTDPDHYPNTDWIRGILNYKAPITRHTLSFSGGTQKLRFYGNLGYLYQEGVVSPINLKRYNMTIAVDAEVTNTTTVSIDINGSVTQNNAPAAIGGDDIFTNVTEIPPIYPLKFSNGLPAHALWVNIYESGYNRNRNNMLNSKLTIEQKIPFIPGLALKGAIAYNKNYVLGKTWTLPVTFYALNADDEIVPTQSGPPAPRLSQSFQDNQRLITQAYILYERSFGKHSINALGVMETQKGQTQQFSAGRINYAVELDELNSGSSNKEDMENGGVSRNSAQVGWLYQLNYGFANKYLVGLSGRYDGHYYFAPGERYAFFPAFSLGWNLAEEHFIKNNYPWIDYLKLRGSYGISGNLAGDPFQYLVSYGLGDSYIFGGTSPQQVQGIFENAQANPSITWETAKKTNIGLEGTLWRGKLGFSVDVWRESRSDMLIKPEAVVPEEYGIEVSEVNAGIMHNRGIDVSLTTAQRFANGIRFNAAFNFSFARNKVIQTFENASTFNNPNRRRTGRPWNSQFGLLALGLYQEEDFEADGVTLKPGLPVPSYGPVRPGDIKYADLAGPAGPDGKPTAPDGIINANDETFIGDPLFPQIIFGLNMDVSWKGFDLSMLWQGGGKAAVRLASEMAFPFFNGAKVFREQTDFWTPENRNASYPRLLPAPISNNTQTSSFWIKDGTYLRLKTLELGYTIPDAILQQMHMRSVRFFVSGQNLLTFSKLKFLDPELGNPRARYYFQQKIFSFGVNVGF